jgi:HK97 family phage portal protein
MGFWANIGASLFGPSTSIGDIGAPGVENRGGWLRWIGGRTDSGVDVNHFNAITMPAVYACVNRIANPYAHFPLRVMQRTSSGGGAVVTQHPMSERLGMRPNDFMSSRTLRKTSQGHALLWGNAYQEIERNGKGQAVGLWPLLPNATAPRRNGDALVIDTTIGGQRFTLDQKDVLHVMDLSRDGYVGLSQVGLFRQAIGMGLAMEKFGAKFFGNDAKSGGFLMHPGKLSATAQGNLRGGLGRNAGANRQAAPDNPAAPLEAQGGLDNAHRVKVLEEGMKFIQTMIPPEDAQFLGSREFQIAEVARIFDVPLVLLQSHEKSTSWGSGIEQLMIGFVQQTIAPWVDAWEQEMNWKLFTPAEREQGLYVKHNLNALLRGDMAARAAFYTAMMGVGMTINTILGLEDMDGIGPDGDVSFVSVQVQPISRAINPPEPPSPPTGPNPENPA